MAARNLQFAARCGRERAGEVLQARHKRRVVHVRSPRHYYGAGSGKDSGLTPFLAKRIIEMHGGKIRSFGCGTRLDVFFTLPVSVEQQARPG